MDIDSSIMHYLCYKVKLAITIKTVPQFTEVQ
jgi:hypothetical protein